MQLSLPQLSYLQESLSSSTPIRPDGRALTAFRPIRFATSILQGCLGSAQLSWGQHSFVVGVKGEIHAGLPVIEHSVDVLGERDDDPLTTLLGEVTRNLLSEQNFATSADLHVCRGFAWRLTVDVVVSNLPEPANIEVNVI